MTGFPVPLWHNVPNDPKTALRRALKANFVLIYKYCLIGINSGVTFTSKARYVIGEQETSRFHVQSRGDENPHGKWEQLQLFNMSNNNLYERDGKD